MDPNDLNTAQLREVLKKANLSASGSKAELVAKVAQVFPNGVIFNNMAQGEERTESAIVEPSRQASSVNIAGGEPSINNAVLGSNTIEQASTSQDLNRELDLIRQETFEAFEGISLWRSIPLKSTQKYGRGSSGPSERASSGAKPPESDRCFNCNEVGHFMSACRKPKRARGSCFTCGTMGYTEHTSQNCPKATNSGAAQLEETALVEKPEPTSTSAGIYPGNRRSVPEDSRRMRADN
ncbi:hypothetical protein KPH14_012219 [Odynerus spinipes]|uniref:Uncharacterized protein n=1 Tax=Odynerus spinipes TaxID=1348599 RepID=A0AAD9VLX1_9HYME|nr:hypothetical protein KPH14_012219 [Odynerus spinipes]